MYTIGRLPDGTIAASASLNEGDTLLAVLRREIDAIDTQLAPLLAELNLLEQRICGCDEQDGAQLLQRYREDVALIRFTVSERLEICKKVAAHKTPGAVQDPHREQAVHDRYAVAFTEKGLPLTLAKQYTDALLQLSRDEQEHMLRQSA